MKSMQLIMEGWREYVAGEENSDKKYLFVLVGPPAAGKSTWINKTLSQINPYIVSRDNIVDEVATSHGLMYDDTFEAPNRNPNKSEKLGDIHPQYGEIVKSPEWMTWQPLSYKNVLAMGNEINAKLASDFKSAVGNNVVVVDMTNMDKKSRKNAISNALGDRMDEYYKIAVEFPFRGNEKKIMRISTKRSFDTGMAGNRKTIPQAAYGRMFSSYQPASKDEGFDEIVAYDNSAIFKKIISNIWKFNKKVKRKFKKFE